VGAGIGGPDRGGWHCKQRRGWDVTVAERAPGARAGSGRGLGLGPNALHALDGHRTSATKGGGGFSADPGVTGGLRRSGGGWAGPHRPGPRWPPASGDPQPRRAACGCGRHCWRAALPGRAVACATGVTVTERGRRGTRTGPRPRHHPATGDVGRRTLSSWAADASARAIPRETLFPDHQGPALLRLHHLGGSVAPGATRRGGRPGRARRDVGEGARYSAFLPLAQRPGVVLLRQARPAPPGPSGTTTRPPELKRRFRPLARTRSPT